MKLPLLLLLFAFVAPENFSFTKKSKHDQSTAFHYHNNIIVNNFDGARSTISITGNSATINNPDGTHSTIDFYGQNSSTLIGIDGTSMSITHHGNMSSTIFNNADGSQIFVNHMNSTSNCSTPNGNHNILHNFGFSKEKRYKNEIDVLIHMNWLMRKRVVAASKE